MDQSQDITSAQIRAARAFLDLSQDELASEAGITRKTLYEMETGSNVRTGNLTAVLRVLTRRGITFVGQDDRIGLLGPAGELTNKSTGT